MLLRGSCNPFPLGGGDNNNRAPSIPIAPKQPKKQRPQQTSPQIVPRESVPSHAIPSKQDSAMSKMILARNLNWVALDDFPAGWCVAFLYPGSQDRHDKVWKDPLDGIYRSKIAAQRALESGEFPTSSAPPVVEGAPMQPEEKKDQWIQCEKCQKWRRQVGGSLDIPDDAAWFCSDNNDPERNSCNAPQESDSEGESEGESEGDEQEEEAEGLEMDEHVFTRVVPQGQSNGGSKPSTTPASKKKERRKKPVITAVKEHFAVGQRVEVLYEGIWYSGAIVGEGGGLEWQVMCDMNVNRNKWDGVITTSADVRATKQVVKKRGAKYTVGQRAEVLFKAKWYNGTVIGGGDGEWQVRCDMNVNAKGVFDGVITMSAQLRPIDMGDKPKPDIGSKHKPKPDIGSKHKPKPDIGSKHKPKPDISVVSAPPTVGSKRSSCEDAVLASLQRQTWMVSG